MSQEIPTPPGAKKKGLSPWAWIAMGCGAFVVVGFVVFAALGFFVFQKGKEVVEEATGGTSIGELVEGFQDDPLRVAAETVIRMDPDLELVSSDGDAGTITFRNERTGEEVTLDFEDVAEGKFRVSTDDGDFSYSVDQEGEDAGIVVQGPEGEARFGASADLSDVPDWVPLYPDMESAVSAFHSSSEREVAGTLGGRTRAAGGEVLEYYEGIFDAGPWKIVSRSSTTTGEGSLSILLAEDESRGRTVNVTVIENDGENQVSIQYGEKKR